MLFRSACIAQPRNIQSYDLAETVNVDDLISSFILKACLFDKKGPCTNFSDCKSPLSVSVMIYERLLEKLDTKLVESLYTGEKPVDCTNCKIVRGCCKRRKLMMAMGKEILQWISSNKIKLSDMHFYL